MPNDKINDPLVNLAQSYCTARKAKGQVVPVEHILAAITLGVALTLQDPELARRLLVRTLEAGGYSGSAAQVRVKDMGQTALLAALAKEA